MSLDRARARRERGARGRRDGRMAEAVAALWLMLKGWQVLGFRLRTPQGEIDLLARKGRTLAVIEVKRRATVELALESIGPAQRDRLLRAARTIASRRRSLRQLDLRLDLIALAPGRFPRHLPNIFNDLDQPGY
ncbi:MAG TPA: YraN family protein [Caulobacteraceae bacterium]|nr:YraN family protein [Caulobacteraceae bacterium]